MMHACGAWPGAPEGEKMSPVDSLSHSCFGCAREALRVLFESDPM